MSLISWTEKLSVNVKEIDDQHKELVAMLNELNDAMSLGKGRDVIEKIISRLGKYASEHFSTEEKYFTQFNYQDALAHNKKHEAFIKKISEFHEDFRSGNLTLTLAVRNFLKEWLINHIEGEDKKYTKCFNDNGLF